MTTCDTINHRVDVESVDSRHHKGFTGVMTASWKLISILYEWKFEQKPPRPKDIFGGNEFSDRNKRMFSLAVRAAWMLCCETYKWKFEESPPNPCQVFNY